MNWSDNELVELTKTILTGLSQAANGLSRLVNKPVRLSSPRLRLVPFASLSSVAAFTLHQPMCTIYQHFDGSIRPDALLMLPVQSSLELIPVLMGERTPAEEITEFECEVLSEVGNVVLNACMAAIAESYGYALQSSLPGWVTGDWTNALRPEDQDEYEGLLLTVNVVIGELKPQAYLLLAMGPESIARLKQGLGAHIHHRHEDH
jgi:chemotaxis protein CheC